jgi:hypothetical protein
MIVTSSQFKEMKVDFYKVTLIAHNIVHSLYHALVGCIRLMFMKVVLNFEELEKWFHTFKICHGLALL